jgi:hypothetical protein
MNIVEPIWERGLIFDTYACRVGKGTHAALQRARHFTRRFRYFLKCDIQKYFDSIDHSVLRKIILGKIKDRQLLALLEKIIAHELPGSASGRGLPIGNLTSQHFANLYLSGLDHHLKETLRVPGYVRYMDDFICFSDEKGSLQAILREIRLYLKEQLGLVLKEKVVKIAPVSEGVPFLGCRVFRGNIRLQRQNLIRLRRKIRKNETLFLHGKITEKKLVQSVGSMVAGVGVGRMSAAGSSYRTSPRPSLSRLALAVLLAAPTRSGRTAAIRSLQAGSQHMAARAATAPMAGPAATQPVRPGHRPA